MRRRPDFEILRSAPSMTPGAPFTITLVMKSAADTPYDGLEISVVGREKRAHRYMTKSESDTHTYQLHHHERTIEQFHARYPSGVLTTGEHRRTLEIAPPADMPPSYASEHTEIAYTLRVHLDIPWWPDLDHAEPLEVVVPPAPPEPRAWVHASTSPTPRDDELFVQVALEGPIVQGERLRGAVSFENTSKRRVSTVELLLEAIETAVVESSKAPTMVERKTWLLLDERPADGSLHSFDLPIPDRMPVGFATPFISVSHRLRVKVDITLGANVEVVLPVRYMPRGTTVVDAEDPLAIAPSAGATGSRAQALATVLRKHGVEVGGVTADRDAFVVTTATGRSVRFSAEGVVDGTRHRAEVAWPSLGLGLELRPRRIFDGGIRLKGDCAMRARSEAQLRAALDDDLVEHLDLLQVAELRDTGGWFASASGERNDDDLVWFMIYALRLDAAFATLHARVPPPVGLERVADGYAALAARLVGTFHAGDLSCSRLHALGLEGLVHHAFDGEAPTDTYVEVTLPPGARMPEAFAAALGSRLGGRVSLRARGACALRLPFVRDASTLDPILERLAESLLALVPGAVGGPYR